MPDTQAKATTRAQNAAKVEEKRRHPEPARGGSGGFVGEAVLLDALLGSSVVDPRLDTHAALLNDPRFSHSANAEQKARIVSGLQSRHGNAYVQRLLESRPVQPKLTVNPPDDQYEGEGDQVAGRVPNRAYVQREPKTEEELEELEKKLQKELAELVEPETESKEQPRQVYEVDVPLDAQKPACEAAAPTDTKDLYQIMAQDPVGRQALRSLSKADVYLANNIEVMYFTPKPEPQQPHAQWHLAAGHHRWIGPGDRTQIILLEREDKEKVASTLVHEAVHASQTQKAIVEEKELRGRDFSSISTRKLIERALMQAKGERGKTQRQMRTFTKECEALYRQEEFDINHNRQSDRSYEYGFRTEARGKEVPSLPGIKKYVEEKYGPKAGKTTSAEEAKTVSGGAETTRVPGGREIVWVDGKRGPLGPWGKYSRPQPNPRGSRSGSHGTVQRREQEEKVQVEGKDKRVAEATQRSEECINTALRAHIVCGLQEVCGNVYVQRMLSAQDVSSRGTGNVRAVEPKTTSDTQRQVTEDCKNHCEHEGHEEWGYEIDKQPEALLAGPLLRSWPRESPANETSRGGIPRSVVQRKPRKVSGEEKKGADFAKVVGERIGGLVKKGAVEGAPELVKKAYQAIRALSAEWETKLTRFRMRSSLLRAYECMARGDQAGADEALRKAADIAKEAFDSKAADLRVEFDNEKMVIDMYNLAADVLMLGGDQAAMDTAHAKATAWAKSWLTACTEKLQVTSKEDVLKDCGRAMQQMMLLTADEDNLIEAAKTKMRTWLEEHFRLALEQLAKDPSPKVLADAKKYLHLAYKLGALSTDRYRRWLAELKRIDNERRRPRRPGPKVTITDVRPERPGAVAQEAISVNPAVGVAIGGAVQRQDESSNQASRPEASAETGKETEKPVAPARPKTPSPKETIGLAIELFRGSRCSKTVLGGKVLKKLTDLHGEWHSEIEYKKMAPQTHGQSFPGIWEWFGSDIQVNENFQQSIFDTSLILVHEAVHVIEESRHVDVELECRELELDYYIELQAGIFSIAMKVGPGQHVKDLEVQRKARDAKQLVDHVFDIEGYSDNPDFFDADWVARHVNDWGGVNNRRDHTIAHYIKKMSEDDKHSAVYLKLLLSAASTPARFGEALREVGGVGTLKEAIKKKRILYGSQIYIDDIKEIQRRMGVYLGAGLEPKP